MADNESDRRSEHTEQTVDTTRSDGPSQEVSPSGDAVQYETIRTRPSEAPRGYGSISSTPGKPQTPMSSASLTPKRPGVPRKASSSHTTHRAKEFSVDDSQEEVDQDKRQAKSTRSLRRQASTIRRKSLAAPMLARVESDEREDDEEGEPEAGRRATIAGERHPSSDDSDQTLRPDEDTEEVTSPDTDDADGSDGEDFTLKARQEAINETHPFGIRIWKPALYKKDRSVQANAEGDIHSTPGTNVSRWLAIFNVVWTLVFGWWLALVCLVGAILCAVLGAISGGSDYASVLYNLAGYIFYPFGKFVRLEHDEAYMDEDEGEGRSISEYERWQTGDLEEGRLFFGPRRGLVGQRRDSIDSVDETDALLGRQNRTDRTDTQTSKTKKRPFGRGQWSPGRVVYFVFFYVILTPLIFLVSAICWFLVFSIPMGRVTVLLLYHLRRHPLALSFHSDSHYSRDPDTQSSSILLCTYRAVGIKYWKYTVDGTNIFLINLLALVAFTIFDFYVLRETLHVSAAIASSGFIFILALLSIIPLAYFIGQAVASISAQSTMGVGATVNAFFSTVIEVFLYCVALQQGKAQLVEGSIIGSIFAGILLLPGMSMCFGAIKRKTQRFNVKSAGVTSTMLMFAIIGSFGPTLFYQIYGSHELNCYQCISDRPDDEDCRRCYFSQTPALNDRFFRNAVQPYIWFAATLLFLSYVIGLIFTLRTHAAIIWSNDFEEKKAPKMEHSAASLGHHDPHGTLTRQATSTSISPRDNIRDTQLYKRILGQSLKSAGFSEATKPKKPDGATSADATPMTPRTPYLLPPDDVPWPDKRSSSVRIPGLSTEDNNTLVRQVAELAATAATVAARDVARPQRKISSVSVPHKTDPSQPPNSAGLAGVAPTAPPHDDRGGDDEHAAGGHDAPNWSRGKSVFVLLSATVAYAVIAEILVDTVDSVLDNVDIDEKFVGITLFALVPNTTEFLNAISFAMNGNIALSMEIGSAYALQVMLLQVPALVLFTAVQAARGVWDDAVAAEHSFNLIFPQWDMVTVILGLFLMNYVIGEGKSNYFKGSMLVLSYLVVLVGFWFTGYNDLEVLGVNRFDTLALGNRVESFKTVGQRTSGMAFPARREL